MISEIYTVEATGSDLSDLVKDGDNIVLREECGLEPVKKANENANPFKFRKITQEENNVFSVLFPEKVEVSKYNEFIPNDVLEALKEFKETCPYKVISIKVWKEKDYDPDPVLVAEVRTADDQYNWADASYVIARWGAALAPFVELKEKALSMWRDRRLRALKRIIRQAENDLADTTDTLEITSVDEPSLDLGINSVPF